MEGENNMISKTMIELATHNIITVTVVYACYIIYTFCCIYKLS